METKFQTSFIPKKGLTPGSSAPSSMGRGFASIFMVLAVILFIISIAAAGGAYAWKQYLITAQVTYNKQLGERQKQFDTDLIEQLAQTKLQIDTARQLLEGHVALSKIFDIISRMTIDPVRFLSLDVSVPSAGSTDWVKIAMSGYGKNLSVVAFQSDVLGQLEQYGLRKIVKNPILANPTLDQSNPTVSFSFSATIDPASLSYRKSLTSTTNTTPSQPQ